MLERQYFTIMFLDVKRPEIQQQKNLTSMSCDISGVVYLLNALVSLLKIPPIHLIRSGLIIDKYIFIVLFNCTTQLGSTGINFIRKINFTHLVYLEPFYVNFL